MSPSVLTFSGNRMPERDGTPHALAGLEVVMRDILFCCSGAMVRNRSGPGPSDTRKSSGGDCIFALFAQYCV